MNWVQAGLENPGRRDKFPLNLPAGFPLVSRNDTSLTRLLADGEIDAVMSARAPSCFTAGHDKVRRLFPDFRSVERDYYRKTGIFPIMHALGIRRDIYEKNRWLAASLFKAYLQAKHLADADLAEVTALKIGLPWVAAEYEATVAAMGEDFWSYGLNEGNRKTLDAMARYSYEQGLAVRLVGVDEMFAKGNLSETRV
jgi:4,5-dihydroxyphthalate decarboxylase